MSTLHVNGRYIVLFDNAVIPTTAPNGLEYIRESDYRKRLEAEAAVGDLVSYLIDGDSEERVRTVEQATRLAAECRKRGMGWPVPSPTPTERSGDEQGD